MKINIDLKYTEAKESEALKKLTSGIDKQIQIIIKSGIKQENIKLVDFSVDEDFDYSSSKVRSLGFVAIQTIEIKIPIAEKKLISTLLDTLTFYKVNNLIMNIETVLSDKLENEIRNNLIKQAINDATVKGKIMAESSNVKLGKVKNIEYGDLYFRPILRGSIRFTPPNIVADGQETKVRSSSIDILGISETEVREKIHVVWYIQQ